MTFRTLRATLTIDTSSSEQGSWVLSAEQPDPLKPDPFKDRRWTEHVAREHYWHLSDLALSLERAFFTPVDGMIPRARERYIIALGALTKYLNTTSIKPGVTREIQELIFALMELEDGRVREMLKPKKSGGRNRDPGDIWQARAYLAIAVESLIDARVEKGGALDRIIGGFGYLEDLLLSTGNGTFRGALAKWHQDFVARVGCEERAQETFNRREDIIFETRCRLNTNDPDLIAADICYWAAMSAIRAMNSRAYDRAKVNLGRRLPAQTKRAN